jgi:hypothetical protein
VSSAAEKVIAWAFDRVQARYRETGGEVPPFEQMAGDVLAEIGAELDRRIRKAAKHLQVAAELSAVIRQSPALRAVAVERRFTDLDLAALMAGDQAPPKAMNGHGPRAGWPPPGHPERRLDPDDEEN